MRESLPLVDRQSSAPAVADRQSFHSGQQEGKEKKETRFGGGREKEAWSREFRNESEGFCRRAHALESSSSARKEEKTVQEKEKEEEKAKDRVKRMSLELGVGRGGRGKPGKT